MFRIWDDRGRLENRLRSSTQLETSIQRQRVADPPVLGKGRPSQKLDPI